MTRLAIPDEPIEFDGELDAVTETKTNLLITPLISGEVTLVLFDADALEDLADKLADEETAEEWFAVETASYINDVIVERKLGFLDLSSGAYNDELIEAALALANAAFAEYGVKVIDVTELEITASDKELAKLKKQLASLALA